MPDPLTRRTIRFDNGRPMRSDLPFEYLDPDLPTLKRLREQEELDRLVEESTGEFDLIVKVIRHVKTQWDHSWHAPMQHVNALEVLEDVRSGLRGNFCVYFTHVLLQALWSLGIPCRYVYVAVHHWQSHSTSECWSNEHRKWVSVDADFNLHYVRPELAGPGLGPVRRFVPQNAREIQQAWRRGEMAHVLPVQGDWGVAFDPETRLGPYYGGVFGFVADYQRVLESGPPEWAGQRCQWFIWREANDPLPDYHLHHFELTHGNGVCTPVSDPDQFYWPLNEVVVDTVDDAHMQGDVLHLRFETFTPFFATFLVRHNGGPWLEHRADRSDGHHAWGSFAGPLADTRDVIEVRTRNRAGRLGPISVLEIAAPPYVPPAPASSVRVADGSATLGAFAAHRGRLYVPHKVESRIRVFENGREAGAFGTPIALPPYGGPAPAEPWSEAVNLARAAAAPPGHLLAPQACTVAPDGTLYVGDAENYRIQAFSWDGLPRAAWGSRGTGDTQFLHIRALAAAADGSLYVADSGYAGPVGLRTEHVSRLRRFEAEGRLLATLAESGSDRGCVCSPAGLAVDEEGGLWVADSGNHRIQCFSPEGDVVACWGRRGDDWGELRFPTGVAAARDDVYVADPQHRCVWKFARSGQALVRLGRGADGVPWLRPGRLAADGDRLWVGDVGTGIVHEFRL